MAQTTDHVLPVRLYVIVAACLFILLAITVIASMFNLGPFNIIVALAIAATKAILVVLYFMHVKYGPRLVWVFAAGGVLWLIIMFMLLMPDFMTR